MKGKSATFFWPSYADLMTSLFFIMLVLYVLTFIKLKNEQAGLLTKAEQYDKIMEIEESLKNISDNQYFRYNEDNKRHELLVDVQFKSWNYKISPQYKNDLINAGKQLRKIVENIKTDKDVRYLVVIEGMAARGERSIKDWEKRYDGNYYVFEDYISGLDYAYILSYRRALELKQLWENNDIFFNSEIFEVIIAGSGLYGTDRYIGQEEHKNKRFLIQIIPKIGKIHN